MIERETEAGLREVVHQRVRLGILAVLARRGRCTFSQLRDALGQSDGGLSRHLGVLEQHEYITTEKVFENRRPRTWVRMTEAGVDAFREEREVLAKLLASVSHETAEPGTGLDGDDRAADMAIVFAALLASDDTGNDTGADARPDDPSADSSDRSILVPTAPTVAGRRTDPVASGPISARYEFPSDYADFSEQREQRLMMMSHGLRGGWISTWRVDRHEHEGEVVAHVLVVELAGAPDCEAILAVMGAPTVSLSGVPAALAYLLPAAEDGAPRTAVAWFSVGRHLASVVVTAAADLAVPVLDHLVTEAYRPLSSQQS